MQADFWHQRWTDKNIGFHQIEVNRDLKKFWPELSLAQGDRVFVPLCGKSKDMCWLAENHFVIGNELSPLAVEDFFQENDIAFTRRAQDGFTVCESRHIRLLCGDFFALQAACLEDVRAIYDRASLIALPPDMRRRFAEKLTELFKPPLSMLLITLEYSSSSMDGPPFSVPEDEVHALFGRDWSIRLLSDEDILEQEAKFRQRGVTRLREKIYLLSLRG